MKGTSWTIVPDKHGPWWVIWFCKQERKEKKKKNSVLLIDKPFSDKVYRDSWLEFNPENKGFRQKLVGHVIWMQSLTFEQIPNIIFFKLKF